MLSPEDIRMYILQGLPCEHVSVEGDGHHFEALVVSGEFRGLGRVQRHQRVYRALGDRMKQEIHALSMRTLSPEEWKTGRS